ncbi:MAG: hypothetical protein AAF358_04640 [Pseudomonadota bacterium]
MNSLEKAPGGYGQFLLFGIIRRSADWILCVCLLGPVVASAQCSDEQQVIDRYLSEVKPERAGPGHVIAFDRGPVAGASRDALVLLYTFQISSQRERFPQYLTIFKPRDGNCVASQAVSVGFRGVQHFTEIDFEDKKVWLSGMQWVSGDAMCCPSIPIKLGFSYNGKGAPIPLAGKR